MMVTSPPKEFPRRRTGTDDPPPRMMATSGCSPFQVPPCSHDLPADRQAEGLGVEPEARTIFLPVVRVAVDLDLVLGDELALALDDVDLLHLEQAGQALELSGDDAVLVAAHASHVDGVERGVDAVLGTGPGLIGELGCVQVRLRRDAAPVQAGATQLGLDQPTSARMHVPQAARTRRGNREDEKSNSLAVALSATRSLTIRHGSRLPWGGGRPRRIVTGCLGSP